MTSYSLQKDTIFPRKVNEPHVTKPQYEGSDHSHTKFSYGEKDIQDNPHTKFSHGENTLEFTKAWKNRLTKTNNILDMQKKQRQ